MTFIPNIDYTLKHDICTGCGICIGACSFGAISMIVKQGRFLPQVDVRKCRNSKGCHRCYDACPGVGVDLVGLSNNNINKDDLIGSFHSCYVGNSTDQNLRYHAASGGMVSQLLIWLLENRMIDGALVSRFDKSNPLKVKSFIARSKEDILLSKSSKYAPVSFHDAVKELRSAQKGKYVVVGLPCHIHGFRKLEKIDKNISSKVVAHFALYCSASRTFNFTEYLMNERHIDIDKIDFLAYRDNGCLGGIVVKGPGVDFYEDYQSYSHPLRSIFIPRRCLLCIDHFGELGDLSFGDIHVGPYLSDKVGVNSIISRNQEWDSLLNQAVGDGVISLKVENVDRIKDSQPSAKMKKGRNARFIFLLNRIKMVTPVYDYKINKVTFPDIVKYAMNRLMQFIGRHRKIWFVIPLIKSKVVIK